MLSSKAFASRRPTIRPGRRCATTSTASEHAPTVRFPPVTPSVIPMTELFHSSRAFRCPHTCAGSRFCARSRRLARSSQHDGLMPYRSVPWVRCMSVVTVGHATRGRRCLARASEAGIDPRLTGPSWARRSTNRTSRCPRDDDRRHSTLGRFPVRRSSCTCCAGAADPRMRYPLEPTASANTRGTVAYRGGCRPTSATPQDSPRPSGVWPGAMRGRATRRRHARHKRWRVVTAQSGPCCSTR
jgi:hypothetical protein